jgi:hypothetical protein
MGTAKIDKKNYVIDDKMKRLTTLDSRYYFAPSGVHVPSTTYILESYPKTFWYYEWLKKVGTDADEIRDEAGRRGSVVHTMTEDYDQGAQVNLLDETGEPICLMSEWAMFERYVEFRNRFECKIHFIEMNLVSEELGFGGTLDRFMMIKVINKNILVDIKTGNNIYPHYWCQQAAYKRLLEEYYATTKKVKKIEIDDVAILWLNAKTRTEGKGDAIQGHGWQLILRGDDGAKDWEVFLATKRLWEAENGDSKPKQFSYSISHKK